LTGGDPSAGRIDPATGRLTGFSVEFIDALAGAADVEIVMSPLPLGRALHVATTDAGACVFPVNRTPTRGARFKWVGPVVEGGWALFARADSAVEPMNSIEEARGLVIGVRINGAIEAHLRSIGVSRIVTASDGALNLKQLASGRIDLWAAGSRTGPAAARAAGVDLKRIMFLERSEFSLACNTDVDDDIIVRLNAALDALRSRGVIEAIIGHRF